MQILAIDPGPVKSAAVVWDGARIVSARYADTVADLLHLVEYDHPPVTLLAVEMIASYGMAVGAEVFSTCVNIGRVVECWRWSRGTGEPLLIKRGPIKLHHCQSTRANDSNIRTALIDRFGPPGTKKEPGFTYGLTKDLWAAFALAVYVGDTQAAREKGGVA